jgi:hypothetical protein
MAPKARVILYAVSTQKVEAFLASLRLIKTNLARHLKSVYHTVLQLAEDVQE